MCHTFKLKGWTSMSNNWQKKKQRLLAVLLSAALALNSITLTAFAQDSEEPVDGEGASISQQDAGNGAPIHPANATLNEDGTYTLSARLEIERINEQFGIDLPISDEYLTIGGLILCHYKSFPKMHEVIQIGQFRFKILKVESNKIELITLKIDK